MKLCKLFGYVFIIYLMTAGALCNAAAIQQAFQAAATALRGGRLIAIVPSKTLSIDAVEQLLKKMARRQQAANPAEQTINAGDLRNGIIQDNSPAIALPDQTEMVITGPAAMPNAAAAAQTAASSSALVPIAQANEAREHRGSIAPAAPTIAGPAEPAIALGLGTEHIQAHIDRVDRSLQGLHARPGLPNVARALAAQAQAAQPQAPRFVYQTMEQAWHDWLTGPEIAGVNSALQDGAQSRALDSSIDQILAKLAIRHHAAQAKANNDGEASDDYETEAATTVAGGPGLQPPTDDEDEEAAGERFTQFANDQLLQDHFDDHVIDKAEWGQNHGLTKQTYLKKAQDLLRAPIGGDIEGFTSKNGWTFRYNKATNEFATAKPNGTIETIFRPTDGIAYWIDQILKYKYRV